MSNNTPLTVGHVSTRVPNNEDTDTRVALELRFMPAYDDAHAQEEGVTPSSPKAASAPQHAPGAPFVKRTSKPFGANDATRTPFRELNFDQ